MLESSLIEIALRRERLLVIAGLAFVVLASWGYLLAGAGMQQEMGGMLMPMSSGPWTPGHALVVVAMWVAMMAAMMLPSAAPMVLFYAAIARQRSDINGFDSMWQLRTEPGDKLGVRIAVLATQLMIEMCNNELGRAGRFGKCAQKRHAVRSAGHRYNAQIAGAAESFDFRPDDSGQW